MSNYYLGVDSNLIFESYIILLSEIPVMFLEDYILFWKSIYERLFSHSCFVVSILLHIY